MTVYVDSLVAYAQKSKPGGERYFGEGQQSCHMMTDGPIEELHKFAEGIGLRRSWVQESRSPFQTHYDLTPSKRALAVKAGAKEVSTLDMMNAVRQAHGLGAL